MSEFVKKVFAVLMFYCDNITRQKQILEEQSRGAAVVVEQYFPLGHREQVPFPRTAYSPALQSVGVAL